MIFDVLNIVENPNGAAQIQCKENCGKSPARLDFSFLKDLKFDDIECVNLICKTFNTEG